MNFRKIAALVLGSIGSLIASPHANANLTTDNVQQEREKTSTMYLSSLNEAETNCIGNQQKNASTTVDCEKIKSDLIQRLINEGRLSIEGTEIRVASPRTGQCD